ncbi:MAG: energy transducer TonB [Proteobacteria bacterium]|nr:energy transducer TonB [Pseudomonadota bacterium]
MTNINYQTSHLTAFISAALVHSLVAAWAIFPSSPIVINQQAIRVSFVAPSSSDKKSFEASHKKIAINTDRENALKQKQDNKVEKSESETKKNQLAGKQTSGREDPNATATKAAESDPIFNANYLNNPAPYYPLSAKRKGIQGKVLLSVVVKVDGTAAAVNVSRSSGSSDLDEAALEAVKQWKFIPARNKGQFVQASVIVPVEFKII